MRLFLAVARRKQLLGATIIFILGISILVFCFWGGSTPASSGAEIDTFADDQAVTAEEIAPEPPRETEAKPNSTPAATYAIVYISGAVRRPDVYQVPVAARVKDVVLAAGGLTEDAAIDEINLADRVADAQHIHIRRQGESPSSPAATGSEAAGDSKDGLLNLNTATATDLDALPGIGPSIAERIVEYRTTNGPFQ